MTFYAVEIDVCPAFGWEGGPNANVRIKALKNRHERRNRNGDLIQHAYTLPFQNIEDSDYLDYIKSAFMAMGGPADSFLAKDFGDFEHGFGDQSAAMPFGVGDGVTTVFPLTKTYSFGTAEYARPITKPVAGAQVYANGVLGSPTVSSLTGDVTFAVAPGVGVVLSWRGEFRVPVRFSDFSLPTTIDNKFGNGKFATNGSCSLIEVFGE